MDRDDIKMLLDDIANFLLDALMNPLVVIPLIALMLTTIVVVEANTAQDYGLNNYTCTEMEESITNDLRLNKTCSAIFGCSAYPAQEVYFRYQVRCTS